jgi:hypothetical protein
MEEPVAIGARHLHFKSGVYLPIAVAQTSDHNGDEDVVYVVLATGKITTRALRQDSRKKTAWLDEVRWPDGVTRPRFIMEDSLSQLERDGLQRIWKP